MSNLYINMSTKDFTLQQWFKSQKNRQQSLRMLLQLAGYMQLSKEMNQQIAQNLIANYQQSQENNVPKKYYQLRLTEKDGYIFEQLKKMRRRSQFIFKLIYIDIMHFGTSDLMTHFFELLSLFIPMHEYQQQNEYTQTLERQAIKENEEAQKKAKRKPTDTYIKHIYEEMVYDEMSTTTMEQNNQAPSALINQEPTVNKVLQQQTPIDLQNNLNQKVNEPTEKPNIAPVVPIKTEPELPPAQLGIPGKANNQFNERGVPQPGGLDIETPPSPGSYDAQAENQKMIDQLEAFYKENGWPDGYKPQKRGEDDYLYEQNNTPNTATSTISKFAMMPEVEKDEYADVLEYDDENASNMMKKLLASRRPRK